MPPFRDRLSTWASRQLKPWTACPDCAAIDISTQSHVYEQRRRLQPLVVVGAEEILGCPVCHQLYLYTSWLSEPDWGQAMEGITEAYEVEALYKRTCGELLTWLQSLKTTPIELVIHRCPRCLSPRVSRSGPDGQPSYHCHNCDLDETLAGVDRWTPMFPA